MPRRAGVAGGAVLAALAIAGCGDKVIDDEKAEGFIEDGLESQSRLRVASVDCPADVEVERGRTFDCTAVTDRGRYTITIRMTDDDGTIAPVGAERVG
jgi:Domain of unknown function (DUF4333)